MMTNRWQNEPFAEGLELYKEERKMEKGLKEKLQKLFNGTGKVQDW